MGQKDCSNIEVQQNSTILKKVCRNMFMTWRQKVTYLVVELFRLERPSLTVNIAWPCSPLIHIPKPQVLTVFEHFRDSDSTTFLGSLLQ